MRCSLHSNAIQKQTLPRRALRWKALPTAPDHQRYRQGRLGGNVASGPSPRGTGRPPYDPRARAAEAAGTLSGPRSQRKNISDLDDAADRALHLPARQARCETIRRRLIAGTGYITSTARGHVVGRSHPSSLPNPGPVCIRPELGRCKGRCVGPLACAPSPGTKHL